MVQSRLKSQFPVWGGGGGGTHGANTFLSLEFKTKGWKCSGERTCLSLILGYWTP